MSKRQIAEEVFPEGAGICSKIDQEGHVYGMNDDDVICRLCAIERVEKAMAELVEWCAKIVEEFGIAEDGSPERIMPLANKIRNGGKK